MTSPFAAASRFARRQMLRWQAHARAREVVAPDAVGNDPAAIPAGQAIPYRCNLCGTTNRGTLAQLAREVPSCVRCGSTVRFRAMAYLVTLEVLGQPAALPDLAARPDITGLGLTDADAYAQPLANVFAYENTWFHMEPRVDITQIDASREQRYDFVLSSDVFEHVLPPVSRAFVNARRLLKPGGKFICTVPFNFEAQTLEHYPDLHDWTMAEVEGRWVLDNVTADGRVEHFENLVFHGGPGSTLEMRLFSLDALRREFDAAGFSRIRVAAEPWLPFGIHWPEPWSVPIVAYA
ncbi:MAG: methyltransferase domain-containing protein [Betaproteobacteria bacterium]